MLHLFLSIECTTPCDSCRDLPRAGGRLVIGMLSREPVPYAGVSEQPDVPVSTGVIENPDAPADRQRYKMKYVKLSSGTLVPAIGVTVQF